MSLETLAIAADFVESAADQSPTRASGRRTVSSRRFHAYSKQPLTEVTSEDDDDRRTLSSSGYGDDDDFSVDQSGPRAVHNKLEKNRRAHLKDCFKTLKSEVPSLGHRKLSNLTILRGALRYIQTLKRQERELLQMKQTMKCSVARQLIFAAELRQELHDMNVNVDEKLFVVDRDSDEETRSTSTATAEADSPIVSDDEDHLQMDRDDTDSSMQMSLDPAIPSVSSASTKSSSITVPSAIVAQLHSTSRKPVSELLHQTITQRVAAQQATKSCIVYTEANSSGAIPAYIMTGSQLIPGNILVPSSLSSIPATIPTPASTHTAAIKTTTPSTQSVVFASPAPATVFNTSKSTKVAPISAVPVPLNFLLNNTTMSNSTMNAHIAAITKLANAAGSHTVIPANVASSSHQPLHINSTVQYLIPANLPISTALNTKTTSNITIIPPILNKSVFSNSRGVSSFIESLSKSGRGTAPGLYVKSAMPQTQGVQVAAQTTMPTFFLTNSGVAATLPSSANTTTVSTNQELNTTLLTLLRSTTNSKIPVSLPTPATQSSMSTMILQPHAANLAALNPVLSSAISRPVSLVPNRQPNSFTFLQQVNTNSNQNIASFQTSVNAQQNSQKNTNYQSKTNAQNVAFFPSANASALTNVKFLQPNGNNQANATFSPSNVQQNFTILQPIVNHQQNLSFLQQHVTVPQSNASLVNTNAQNPQNVSLLQLLSPNSKSDTANQQPVNEQATVGSDQKLNRHVTTITLADYLKKTNIVQQIPPLQQLNQVTDTQMISVNPQTTSKNAILLNTRNIPQDAPNNDIALNKLLLQPGLNQMPLLSPQLLQSKQLINQSLLKPVIFLSLTSSSASPAIPVTTINSTVSHLT